MKKLKRFLSLALVLCLILSVVPFGTYAATVGTKPANGTVSGEPFNTKVSANYRIPGLVNFNGTLIATADARWDYEKDGGGMDLVVSRSTDGGSTWNYTFAGYLGDNGNVWNADSTTLMDPVIITDGSKLYLLADMFPAGYSISSSSTTNAFSDTAIGFDANGNLLLSKDNRSTYGYYLKDGKIYSTNGTEQSGYTVQGWYDLYQNGTYVTNLFFSDSPFQVRATSYICMTTSTDGVNWSDPTLLNVKPEGTSWMVLGPGSGLVTSDGNIAFTAYDGSNIYLIYGKDGSWNTVKTNAASNESSIIELNDGTIRAFVKRASSNTIAYVDFTKTSSGYTAGSLVSTSDANFSQCMVSSLHYSKTLNGKEVVLVCCPSDSAGGTWAGRFNGKIYVYTLDSNNAMTLAGSYQLNNSFFAYSNMAEMDDGSIAVLYEDDCISYSAGDYYGNASHITYTTVDLETATGLNFDEVEDENIVVAKDENGNNVEVNFGSAEVDSMTVTSATVDGLENYVAYDITPGNNYKGSAVVTIPLRGQFSNTTQLRGFVVNNDSTITYITDVERDYEADTLTFKVPHFSVVGAEAVPTADTTTVNVEVPTGGSITKTFEGLIGTNGQTGTLSNGVTYTVSHTPATSTNINEWQLVENGVSGITTTDKYLIVSASSGSAYALTSAGGATAVSITDGAISLDSVPTTSNMVFTFGSGYTISGTTGYLYPTASRSWGSWYYNLAYGQGSSQNVSIEGTSGVTISRSVSSGRNSTTSYLTLDSSAGASNSGDTVYLFKLVEINESTAASTTITFTGPATANSTTVSSVTIGDYTFNTTVKEIVYGDLFDGIVGTQTYEGDNGNVEMNGKEITALTTSVGTSFQLGTGVEDAESIVWEIADKSIATVSDTGVVTGVSAGKTTVTVTVTKNGVVDTETIPIYVIGSFGTGSSTTTVFYYIEELTDTDAYYTLYSTNVSEELVQVIEGQVIYFERPVSVPFGMIWMAAPEEGYALTYMAASDTEGQYYPLHDGDYTLKTDSTSYYAGGSQGGYPYYNIYTYYGGDQTTVNTMLNKALAEPYLCDGAMSMGRKANDTSPKLGSSLSFRSEKLPEVNKSVAYLIRDNQQIAYTEGMLAQAGDVIVFNVTVKQFDAENDVTYDSETLTENLSGATFDSTSGSTTKTFGLSDTALGADTEYTYQVYYTVKESDLDTTITNTVNFTYSYQSTYSTGSMTASAKAEAKITAATFTTHDIVIDFGLPVTIDYSASHGLYNLESGTATYGTVSVTGNKVTYTPTNVLLAVDTVTLYNTKGAEYTFKVYPATTVYYEEGFATYGDNWSGASKGTGTQQTQVLGSKAADTYNYGYDIKYANEAGMSNGTAATTSTVGASAEFTFTGTGIDIYANCAPNTGVVAVIIKKADGTIEKFYQVDTQAKNGTSGATTGQATTLNSLPIVSVNGLAHGEHTVTIMHVNSSDPDRDLGDVNIDGFRVYNTIADSTVFKDDLEDNPEFYQLRDYVLNALKVGDSDVYGSLTKMAEQVYAGISNDTEAPSAAVLTKDGTNLTVDVQDLLDNGPKNELFLYAGQTLTFKVTTNRVMQIGLKAPNATTTYTVTVNGAVVKDNASISTSTDMFYEIADKAETATEYTITITNKGSNILSITDLKICDDPNASFEALTAEDIELALKAMGYSDVTYADATLTVPVVDYTGKELTSVTLTANGVVGENAVFTAEEILAAVKEALPEGYGLVDESKVADVTVAYGESASASAKAGKTVTLTIKFISARNGKRVDTAEITVVQSSAKNWTRVSASQIKALAPEGYRAFWMVNMTLVYGKDATIVVPVY